MVMTIITIIIIIIIIIILLSAAVPARLGRAGAEGAAGGWAARGPESSQHIADFYSNVEMANRGILFQR